MPALSLARSSARSVTFGCVPVRGVPCAAAQNLTRRDGSAQADKRDVTVLRTYPRIGADLDPVVKDRQ